MSVVRARRRAVFTGCAALISGSLLVTSLTTGLSAANAAAPTPPPCASTATPAGALPPAKPVFCNGPLPASAAQTATTAANSWLDPFDGMPRTQLGAEYQQFVPLGGAQVFRDMNHWMVDVVPGVGAEGVSMITPNRSFSAEQGKLVIEADYAAAIPDYGDTQAWGEIDVTTAAQPTRHRPDGLYAYDEFSGNWTFGCRFQPTRVMTCALQDDTDRGANNGGRRMEISFFQTAGGTVTGGYPNGTEPWRQCTDGQPDLQCRDRLRLEIEKDRVTLYVNGVLYQQNANLPPQSQIPTALLGGGPVHVYFSSVVNGLKADTTRFHWDQLSVNPSSVGVPSTTTPTVPTTSGTSTTVAHCM
jgi:hypothetical protein